MATVELAAVTKAYGGHVAVSNLSLSVASGECVALLGPSGCGKTTTLNMIAGFIDPDAGRIAIGGVEMAGVPPYRRDTGMVFQSYALFPHLTVADNLAFGLRMRRVARTAIAERVRRALELVHLTGLDRRYPKELSGGQQQRVAVARALAIEPAVLLLDEPLSNLDAKLRQEMRLELVELQKRLAITTIFVTHDQEEALAIADRVAVMDRGAIEQIAPPAEIYARPRTEFVARFIGEGNFLPGRVAAVDGARLVVETDAGQRVLAARADPAPVPGTRVLAMVRPERVRLAATASGLDNAFPAEVRGASFLGAVTRVQLALGSRPFAATLHEAAAIASLAPGQPVWVEWPASDCLVIPSDRG